MTNEYENLIFDACLDEILRAAKPPDLSLQIVRKWEEMAASEQPPTDSEGRSSRPGKTADDMYGFARPSVVVDSHAGGVPRPASKPPLSTLQDTLPRHPAAGSLWRFGPWIVAATILIAVTVGTIWVWQAPPQDIAGRPVQPDVVPPELDSLDNSDADPLHAPEQSPVWPTRDMPPGELPQVADGPRAPSAFEDAPPFGGRHPASNTMPPSPRERRRVEPLADAEIVARIDQALQQAWAEHDVTPSPPATDSQWCRRVFLRLLGRIPRVDELQRFDADRSPSRRSRLVDQLLETSPYTEEYVRNWSLLWSNFLVGRQGGTRPDDTGNREGLEEYLRAACRDNLPYDRLAFELLTATGASHKNQADFNGATNFLLSSWGDRQTQATAQTCRVFLGKQMRCVQCHNHPTNDWQQEQFWQLNAMLRQTHVEGRGDQTRLVNRDFQGESQGTGDGEIYFELPNGELRVAYPGLPDGTPVSPSGRLADVDRRELLAMWIVAQDDLAAAFVNRIWGHFFGFGFANPVDDMGPHNPASHPALLELLSQQFAAHNYDMRRFYRWVTLSQTFGLSSQMAGGNVDDTPGTGMPLFSRYYTRQLQPEEVYQSLLVAANTEFKSWTDLTRDRQAWLGQVTRRMETDEGHERSSFDGGIGQSLLMMNGSLVQRAVRSDNSSLLSMVINSDMSPDDKVEHLFLAAVSRKPASREVQLARRMLKERSHETSVLQDIWWALLNSNEFILDH